MHSRHRPAPPGGQYSQLGGTAGQAEIDAHLHQWTVTASILTATPLGPVVVGSLTAALSDHHGQVTYRIPGLWLQFDVETEDRAGASLTDLQIIVHQPTRTRPQAA